MRTNRTWIGELDVTKVGRFVTVDLSDFTVGTLTAEPRFGASLGSWEATVKPTGDQQTPRDYSTAIKFTASILRLGEKDLTGTDKVAVTNSVAGSSGIVDIYVVAKAGD